MEFIASSRAGSMLVLALLSFAVVAPALASPACQHLESASFAGVGDDVSTVSFLQVELVSNVSEVSPNTYNVEAVEAPTRVEFRSESKAVEAPTFVEFRGASKEAGFGHFAEGEPTASERLFAAPMNGDVKTWVIIATCCGAFSIVASTVLMFKHYQAGVELTRMEMTPHARALAVIELVAGVPAFALLSVASIYFLELQPVWYMFEICVLCYAFTKMSRYFENAAGGSVQIQLSLKAGNFVEPMSLRSEFPCCMLGLCTPPRPPVPEDYITLRGRLLVFLVALPFLSAVLMAIDQRRIITGSIEVPALVTVCAGLVKFILILGKASIGGIANIVELLYPALFKDLKLDKAVSYCSFYLLGMELIPKLFMLIPDAWLPARVLDNGYTFEHWEQGVFVSGSATCFATVLVTLLAWQAFPVDESHYPELFSAGADRSLKPKLDRVVYCPFCGSDELALESGALKPKPEESAACHRCRSYGIPLQMEVRRPNLGGAGAAGATVPRNF